MRLIPSVVAAHVSLALLASPAATRADDDIVAPLPASDDGTGHESRRDAQARLLFEHGRHAYDAEDFASAAIAFERAFALSPRPLLLLDAGNAWERARDPARAAAALREYLVLVPDARDRTALRARVAHLERAADDARERASDDGDGALLAGRTLTWIALAGGLVAAGTGLAFWLDADSRYDALANGCGRDRSCTDAEIGAVSSSLDAANVSFAVAGGALALSLALFFIEGAMAPSDERPRDRAGVAVSLGLGSLSVAGWF